MKRCPTCNDKALVLSRHGGEVCLHCDTRETILDALAVEQSDGTERLDVEIARKRVKALASDLAKLASEASSLSVELHKLLNELDGMPSADLTEPHLQVNHV